MFKHLFKMIWNKKKQNSLLISEIFLSFLVIFGVFSYAINAYNNYAMPMGIKYKPVWVIRIPPEMFGARCMAVKVNVFDSLGRYSRI